MVGGAPEHRRLLNRSVYAITMGNEFTDELPPETASRLVQVYLHAVLWWARVRVLCHCCRTASSCRAPATRRPSTGSWSTRRSSTTTAPGGEAPARRRCGRFRLSPSMPGTPPPTYLSVWGCLLQMTLAVLCECLEVVLYGRRPLRNHLASAVGLSQSVLRKAPFVGNPCGGAPTNRLGRLRLRMP